MNKPSMVWGVLLAAILPLDAQATHAAVVHVAPYVPVALKQPHPDLEAALQSKHTEPKTIAPVTALAPSNEKAIASVPTLLTDAPLWEIKPADGTLQRLFSRWAKQADWTTIWDADQDLPLVATAQFTGSFTDAVQDVLHTTHSTDTPLHPCFYTNHVMRVVPISTVCDPAKD